LLSPSSIMLIWALRARPVDASEAGRASPQLSRDGYAASPLIAEFG
jgi:hypothetical protein